MSTLGESPVESDLQDDKKKREVEKRLQKRNDERQAELQKRQEEKSLTDAAQESTVCFLDNFSKEKQNIESQLSNSEQIPENGLVEHFDNVSSHLAKLQKYVSESTMFLSSYEVSKAQQTMNKLQVAIQEKRDVMIPKKRFAFKSKKMEKAKAPKLVEDVVDHAANTQTNLEVELAECKVVGEVSKVLEKTSEELNQKDVALADLTDCTVKLLGAPSAIHINKLNNCRVFSGPVSGSVFIRQCVGCTFVLPCQQLRIHTTQDTDFYIHVTSKAIIEDSTRTRFAPYNWKYPDLDEHYQVAGLDRKRNNWADIDDFNWLAANDHSPNWSVIAEADQTQHWNI
ncbi:LOW QUALITY PROTEIN: tubulin-specific chaperone C-like [Haliotis rubra]|uniref:LOW QUALITY PROTEIN: tubulin-specific chaperone C-like n=1 Tax=Haliotis rubra TaxID=36100 RepID=UPI001EE521FA|nr:LOW QUALITY PROTEIN: tubulin-specific chaperone C-like [Haliotis rubra]